VFGLTTPVIEVSNISVAHWRRNTDKEKLK
jgi:hypothetical protein